MPRIADRQKPAATYQLPPRFTRNEPEEGPAGLYCSTTRIRPKPILPPFPHIAMHVIEPPGIGLQLPHRMCLSSSIALIPRIASELARIIPKAPARCGPGTRRVLPLRFRRQAVRCPAFPYLQSPDELLHILPGDVFNWPVWITCGLTGVIPHDGCHGPCITSCLPR
jgi:hypothetical protein